MSSTDFVHGTMWNLDIETSRGPATSSPHLAIKQVLVLAYESRAVEMAVKYSVTFGKYSVAAANCAPINLYLCCFTHLYYPILTDVEETEVALCMLCCTILREGEDSARFRVFSNDWVNVKCTKRPGPPSA